MAPRPESGAAGSSQVLVQPECDGVRHALCMEQAADRGELGCRPGSEVTVPPPAMRLLDRLEDVEAGLEVAAQLVPDGPPIEDKAGGHQLVPARSGGQVTSLAPPALGQVEPIRGGGLEAAQ